MSMKPLLVIPRSTQVSRMLDAEALADPRARTVGVVIIAPRVLRPSDLMAGCHFWPSVLARVRVTRIAIVLAVDTYVLARPLLPGCQHRLHEHGIAAAYFHEAHLESDQIRAWFEHRRPQRRVTSDALMKLSMRYLDRDDPQGASHARCLAEATA